MPKRGFPVTHTAKGANRANLANSKTGLAHLPSPGSVTAIQRKRKEREREEGRRRGKEGRLVKETGEKGVAGRTVVRRGSRVD